jgi:hypothetical protein
MKPEIIYQYRSCWELDFLAIRKNGYVIDIACSAADSDFGKLSYYPLFIFLNEKGAAEIQVKDLALYTHWPVHTKEFWELLNIQT